jgi:hypothetical protein
MDDAEKWRIIRVLMIWAVWTFAVISGYLIIF